MTGEPTAVLLARLLDEEARQRAPVVRRPRRHPRDRAAHVTTPPAPRPAPEIENDARPDRQE